MTHICVTEVEYAHLKKEFELIRSVCEFEDIIFNTINKENSLHQRYYNGGRPMVLVFSEGVADPEPLYGFWEFVRYIDEWKESQKTG